MGVSNKRLSPIVLGEASSSLDTIINFELAIDCRKSLYCNHSIFFNPPLIILISHFDLADFVLKFGSKIVSQLGVPKRDLRNSKIKMEAVLAQYFHKDGTVALFNGTNNYNLDKIKLSFWLKILVVKQGTNVLRFYK